MPAIASNPFLGVALHGVGATFAATCYTPQNKVKGWSWQTYWLTQASVCWFLLPIIGALLTIPELAAVLREAPIERHAAVVPAGRRLRDRRDRLRHIDPLHRLFADLRDRRRPVERSGHADPAHRQGHAAAPRSRSRVRAGSWPGSSWARVGIAGAGAAGRLKERDLSAQAQTGEFSLTKGLLLSLLAGVLSAVYGFSLEAGEPIADVATAHGAGVFRGNIVYIFSNTGAFITTALYCLYLHRQEQDASAS